MTDSNHPSAPAGGDRHVGGPVGHGQPVQSVTDAPSSKFDDQSDRIRRYFFTMAFRGVCFVLAIVFTGWVRWAFVLGAVVLPYIAVVLANAVGPSSQTTVTRVDPRSRRTQALTGTIADPPTVPSQQAQPGQTSYRDDADGRG